MSEYSFRYSSASDIDRLSGLWAAVFGDGPELISSFFELLWKPGYCVLAESGGRLASMGFCLRGPEALGRRCGYIYAMATAPEHRGLGLAAGIGRRLMDDAFSNGLDIVATLPAEDSLCLWYEQKLDMRPLFKKGGPGVEFPEAWLRFSAVCGPHDPGSPERLWAKARPSVDITNLERLGWECSFD